MNKFAQKSLLLLLLIGQASGMMASSDEKIKITRGVVGLVAIVAATVVPPVFITPKTEEKLQELSREESPLKDKANAIISRVWQRAQGPRYVTTPNKTIIQIQEACPAGLLTRHTAVVNATIDKLAPQLKGNVVPLIAITGMAKCFPNNPLSRGINTLVDPATKFILNAWRNCPGVM